MNKIITTLLSGMLLLATAACDKQYLDTEPSGSIGEKGAMATLNNFDYLLNGMHSFTYTYWYNQGYNGEHSLNIVRDFLADDVINSTTGNGWYIRATRWLDHRNERSELCLYPWGFYYKIMLNANTILTNIDNPSLTGDAALKNRIKAEALAYRAWGHFQLVQFYGKRYEKGTDNSQLGVVIRDSVSTSEKPRATVEEVYAFINKDLDQALELFKSSSLTDKTRITYLTTLGIKARVMLTQQNWDEAAKFAEEVMAQATTQGITLQKGDALISGFNSTIANSEWIWAYRQTTDQNKYFGHFNAYMSWNFSSSNIRSNPKVINKDLYESMSATDVRRNWWDPGVTDSAGKWSASPVFEKNYPRAKNFLRTAYNSFKFTAEATGNSGGDILLMRLAEMYYIAAEAYAHAGQNEKAQKILNDIMITRDPSYVQSTSTGDDLLQEILRNRRIDLWGEGFRFTDLKRLNQPLNRTAASNTSADVSRKMEVPAGDKEWQFLIPKSEIDANKSMKQNEL